MMLKTLTALAAAFLAIEAGAQTSVDWTNFHPTPATQNSILFRDAGGTPLLSGGAGNNNGDLVQLGYFSLGTTAANFAGVWTPITGAGGSLTTVGDSADGGSAAAGVIQFNSFFTAGTVNVDTYDSVFDAGYYVTQSSIQITNTVPPSGQVLAIRFFDNSAGTYNTVSADNWLWQTPDTAGGGLVSINIAANFLGSVPQALEFEAFATPFLTTIPEPSTFALLGLGLAGVAFARRRLKKA